jgi:hypothetical protein
VHTHAHTRTHAHTQSHTHARAHHTHTTQRARTHKIHVPNTRACSRVLARAQILNLAAAHLNPAAAAAGREAAELARGTALAVDALLAAGPGYFRPAPPGPAPAQPGAAGPAERARAAGMLLAAAGRLAWARPAALEVARFVRPGPASDRPGPVRYSAGCITIIHFREFDRSLLTCSLQVRERGRGTVRYLG